MGQTNYNFLIKTADESKAGTDSNIFLVLYGENGQTVETRLNQYIKGNAFERNDLDDFNIKLDDVGEIYKIDLRSDCRYAGAGWRLSYIKITKEGSKHSSMFNINAWIEDTKTKTYKVSENDWLKNKVVFETEVIEYKRYPIRVPADSTFEYNKTEKTTTGFSYTNAITKKSTLNFNQEMQASASYSKLSKELGNLQPMSTVSGYLKFAFSQGFEDTTFSELVKTENKEISETVKQTLTNGTEYEQKYESICNLIKVKPIVTLNDSVAAEFSLNSDIVFGGFELK